MVGKTLRAIQVVFDYYVILNKKSDYIFVALSDINCYGISKKFMFKTVFTEYPEIEEKLRIYSAMKYNSSIRKNMNIYRRKMMKSTNHLQSRTITHEVSGREFILPTYKLRE